MSKPAERSGAGDQVSHTVAEPQTASPRWRRVHLQALLLNVGDVPVFEGAWMEVSTRVLGAEQWAEVLSAATLPAYIDAVARSIVFDVWLDDENPAGPWRVGARRPLSTYGRGPQQGDTW
jgi:hypothetical protein